MQLRESHIAGGTAFASFRPHSNKGEQMSVDENMVRRIANLARIGVSDDEVPGLAKELGAILGFVEQLSELDTDGVKPLTSAVEDKIRWPRRCRDRWRPIRKMCWPMRLKKTMNISPCRRWLNNGKLTEFNLAEARDGLARKNSPP